MADSEGQPLNVVGFRVTSGPLFQAALPVEPGLTVIYGLNGVGKTYLLDAIHAALSGTRKSLRGALLDGADQISLIIQGSAPHLGLYEPTELPLVVHQDESSEHPNGPVAELLTEVTREAAADEYWNLDPQHPRADGSPSWWALPAVGIGPGSAARAVFEAEAELYEAMAAAEREGGDEQALRNLIRSWSDEEPDNPQRWALEYLMNSAVLWDPEGAPLFEDGLPQTLTGEEIISVWNPIPGMRLLTEGTGAEWATRLTRRMISEFCHDGQWLPTASGWVQLPTGDQVADRVAEASTEPGDSAVETLRLIGIAGLLEAGSEDVAGSPDAVLKPLVHRILLNRWLAFASELANAVYGRLMIDAPSLRLVVDPSPAAEFSGERIRWHSADGPLDSLSRAQLRWANLSIQIALETTLRCPDEARVPGEDVIAFQPLTFLLIDEPEAALHRTAERHMAEGLSWLAGQPGMHAIVASHSPHLLDAPEARAFRVYRRPVYMLGRARWLSCGATLPLDAVSRSNLATLGLEPSDLLARSRVILLVEGQHDELVIREMLTRALDNRTMSRLQILALRGARHLPEALESRLLFDFTEATIVPVVDNIRTEKLTQAWESALVIAAGQGPAAAGDHLRSALPRREASENEFMGEFLSRALNFGVQSRIEPFSFPAVDITDYLPVDEFAPRASNWTALRQEWKQALDTEATQIRSFKAWVAKTCRTDFSDERVLRAAARVDGCPEDFQMLADRVARLAE